MQTSYSKIQLYRTCPKQYEFAYVKAMPRPISRSESYGSSIHNTLKQWGELELKHQSPATAEAQLTMFEQEAEEHTPLTLQTLLQFWQQNFIRTTYDSTELQKQDEQKGTAALTHFYEWWQQTKRSVVTVETGFVLQVHQNKVKGRFDRIEQTEAGLHIIDFKTGSPKDQNHVDENLQLSLYVQAAQELWNTPVAKVSLLFVNEDQTVQVDSARTTDELQTAIDTMSVALTGIEHGEFTATPSVKKCSHCPYKNVCKDSVASF